MDVNVVLAEWSNLLIYSAMAVYAVAFIVYAFDLFGPAFTSDLSDGRETTEAGEAGSRRTRTRTVVAAGAASGGATTATLDGEVADGASATDGGDPSGSNKDSAGDNGDDDTTSTRPRDLRRWARVGTALTVLAGALHVASIVTRTLSVMRVPWSNMMEYALIATAMVVVGYLIFLAYRDVRYLGTFVTLTVLLVLGLCITVFYTPVAQVIPALDNYWIWIHVPIAILSTVILYLSAIIALVQLLRSRSESKPFTGLLRFVNRLPASKDLEKVSYRLAAVGFITWTFTLVAGAFWAEIAWGRYWGWDAKEIWTFVVWVVYAAYLHARATRGWTANRVAILNLVGIATVVFNFTVVNLYFNGLHAYSGV